MWYETIGNIGKYFEVHLDGKKITVSPIYWVNDVQKVNRKEKYEYHPQKIFIGGYGDEKGNSFLLEMGKNSYIHIGTQILSFSSKETIVDYISPVGNSSVVYPWAVDKKGRKYLIVEDVIIENGGDDPYEWYYTHNRLAPPRKAAYPTGISAFKYNGKYFRYEPDPRNHYTWLEKKNHKCHGRKNFWIRMKGEIEKIPLTEDLFAEIMEDFGKEMGFSHLGVKILVPHEI